jgi:hypothetical protein
MNTQEISRFFRSHPLTKNVFRGVFNARDKIKITKGLYVYNTLPRTAPPNKIGHWVCFLVDKEINYFDSTGLPEIEVDFAPGAKVYRNDKPIQSMFSLHCGLYVLYFGLSMMRGYTMKQFLRQFSDDQIENDLYISCKMEIEYQIKKNYK